MNRTPLADIQSLWRTIDQWGAKVVEHNYLDAVPDYVKHLHPQIQWPPPEFDADCVYDPRNYGQCIEMKLKMRDGQEFALRIPERELTRTRDINGVLVTKIRELFAVHAEYLMEMYGDCPDGCLAVWDCEWLERESTTARKMAGAGIDDGQKLTERRRTSETETRRTIDGRREWGNLRPSLSRPQ